MRGARYTHGDGEGAVGGGIFALRRPRPYSRAWAGRAFREFCRSLISGCGRHLDHDAARRVATYFGERENMF